MQLNKNACTAAPETYSITMKISVGVLITWYSLIMCGCLKSQTSAPIRA